MPTSTQVLIISAMRKLLKTDVPVAKLVLPESMKDELNEGQLRDHMIFGLPFKFWDKDEILVVSPDEYGPQTASTPVH